MLSKYDGSHMKWLYETKQYEYIIHHAIEDVGVLHELVTKHGLDYPFMKRPIGNFIKETKEGNREYKWNRMSGH